MIPLYKTYCSIIAGHSTVSSNTNMLKIQRNKIAELIDEHLDALALAETTDNRKPLWLSKRVDIPRASSNFRFFATRIMHFFTQCSRCRKIRAILWWAIVMLVFYFYWNQ